MTREELQQAAMEYCGEDTRLQSAFMFGADYAWEHPHWIPVEERLPKENQSVFICNARHDYGTALYQGGEWFITREYVAINVTHWMPIVPPRKEE
jgi:hypothetical protein